MIWSWSMVENCVGLIYVGSSQLLGFGPRDGTTLWPKISDIAQ